MFEKFKFTSYELFGYLIPGATGLLAAWLLFWTLFHANMPLALPSAPLSWSSWVLLVVCSYIPGHALQALGNFVFRGPEYNLAGMVPPEILETAKSGAAAIAKCKPEVLSPGWLMTICDEAVIQSGKEGEREMFVYREGFYKGISVALIFMTIALLLRFLVPGAVSYQQKVIALSRTEIASMAALCAVAALLMLMRAHRFGRYRVMHILAAFVVLRGSEPAARTGAQAGR